MGSNKDGEGRVWRIRICEDHNAERSGLLWITAESADSQKEEQRDKSQLVWCGDVQCGKAVGEIGMWRGWVLRWKMICYLYVYGGIS